MCIAHVHMPVDGRQGRNHTIFDGGGATFGRARRFRRRIWEATMRSVWSMFLVVPVSLLASHAASATPPPSAPSVATTQLPRGIHLNAHGRYTKDMCDPERGTYCMGKFLMPEGWTPDKPALPTPQGSGGAAPMAPADLLTAYNIPASSASGGKIVAIVDYPDNHAYSDLVAYRSAYNLPSLPHCATGTTPTPGGSPCFAQVTETGSASSGDSGTADGETSLDMDMVSAACPDCSILMVDMSESSTSFDEPVAEAAKLGAVAISISMGMPESSGLSQSFTTAGHLVVSSTGDWGYDDVNFTGGGTTPCYPSSAPTVLAVGGTSLYYNGGTSYDEAVWDDGKFTTASTGKDVTTSGCSSLFPMPAWQQAGLAGTSCTRRATADVSAAATFFSGGVETAIALYYSGQLAAAEGTSASSPMVAGILTRLGLAETIANSIAGGGTSWVYANPGGWNDLAVGGSYPVHTGGPTTDAKNPATCGKLCSVATGWDGPTGLGSPNGTALAALASGGPPPGSGTGTSSSNVTMSSSSSAGSGTSAPPGSGTGNASSSSSAAPTVTDAGASSTSSVPPMGIGLPCTAGDGCTSSICATGPSGGSPVCTQACTASTPCPDGFSCQDGYCFVPAASSGSGTGGGSTGGGSSGCSVSPAGGSALLGLGWITLGLASLVRRRRERRG
jgi:MYXO-CTERM domain-containing protein